MSVPTHRARAVRAELRGRDLPAGAFSDGSVVCPGQNLALLLTCAMLAAVLEEREVHVVEGFEPSKPLPSILEPFELSLQLRPAD